jgi:hydroxymethylpyrimidine/phosphomethylpyrimidine kinase
LITTAIDRNNRRINQNAKSNVRPPLRCALTIAGSDSGGGAGIQADLNTFAALGVHGASVVTCVTAQHPGRVLRLERVRPLMVRLQLQAVFEAMPPLACKTGMLYDEEIIRVVATWFKRTPRPPLIVDPVMVSTSGSRLMKPGALKRLVGELLPRAALVMPNVPEAEALTGMKIADPEDLRAAARELHARHGCAVLAKGGHLKGMREAPDIFYDGRMELLLSAPKVRGISLHGTGCTYAAAVTAFLALGHGMAEAVTRSKAFITRAIAHHSRA